MTKPKPRIYCASPYPRAKMWQVAQGAASILGPDVTIVSTWHNSDISEAMVAPYQFSTYWEQDLKEIRQADALLAYAEQLDKPNGTLVEIGYAIGMELPIHLVGNYKWATWKHLPSVKHHATLREAVISIIRSTSNDPT